MNYTQAKDKCESLNKKGDSLKKRTTETKKKMNQIKVLATAYYKPEKGQDNYATGSFYGDVKINGGGKTSSGKIPKAGMVATDPEIIPTGTELYIPELDLYATAEDTGGDVKGNRIDIFTGKGDWGLEKALDMGKRMVTVIIVKKA